MEGKKAEEVAASLNRGSETQPPPEPLTLTSYLALSSLYVLIYHEQKVTQIIQYPVHLPKKKSRCVTAPTPGSEAKLPKGCHSTEQAEKTDLLERGLF